MIYFTSDTHFGHDEIIRRVSRPFKDAAEMDEVLIRNINQTVSEDDELWILGDFSFHDLATSLRIVDSIRCKNLHLVTGNHDEIWDEDSPFKTLCSYCEMPVEGQRYPFVLFHYPILTWNNRMRGAAHLHGHVHAGADYNQRMREEGELRYDVGVDANGYRPVSLEAVLAHFDTVERKQFGKHRWHREGNPHMFGRK